MPRVKEIDRKVERFVAPVSKRDKERFFRFCEGIKQVPSEYIRARLMQDVEIWEMDQGLGNTAPGMGGQ